MTFSESIRHNIVNCTNFSGRAPRSEYWWFYLFVALGAIPTLILDITLFWPDLSEFEGLAVQILEDPLSFYAGLIPITIFWYFLMFLPLTAAGIRRMHDRDYPGWWYVAALLAIIALSILTFVVIGDDLAMMMRDIADPSVSLDAAWLDEVENLNRTSTIISGVQTLVSVMMIIWLASAGTKGPNRYGEDPLA